MCREGYVCPLWLSLGQRFKNLDDRPKMAASVGVERSQPVAERGAIEGGSEQATQIDAVLADTRTGAPGRDPESAPEQSAEVGLVGKAHLVGDVTDTSVCVTRVAEGEQAAPETATTNVGFDAAAALELAVELTARNAE